LSNGSSGLGCQTAAVAGSQTAAGQVFYPHTSCFVVVAAAVAVVVAVVVAVAVACLLVLYSIKQLENLPLQYFSVSQPELFGRPSPSPSPRTSLKSESKNFGL
jgi:uncharacterized membrane protein YdbT with pleckstrin-like domain